MALANYVKFRRGTPASYAALTTKDADSLYFISEPNATKGLLYLGDKLISGSLTSEYSLNDLEDILLDANISPNSILIFDGTEQKWVNRPFSEVFAEVFGSLAEMQGATASADGAAGTVPKPLAGDQVKFLRGDAKWVTVSEFTPTHAQELVQLRTDVNGIIGNDAGLSMRAVAANEVAKIVANAPQTLNTLKKVADKLEEHDFQFTSIISRIETIENSTIGDLSAELAALHEADNYLQIEINDLDERLKWRGIIDENE